MARRAGRLAQVLGVLVEHCPSSVALTQSRGESAVAAARRWLRTITDVHASRQESTTQVFDGCEAPVATTQMMARSSHRWWAFAQAGRQLVDGTAGRPRHCTVTRRRTPRARCSCPRALLTRPPPAAAASTTTAAIHCSAWSRTGSWTAWRTARRGRSGMRPSSGGQVRDQPPIAAGSPSSQAQHSGANGCGAVVRGVVCCAALQVLDRLAAARVGVEQVTVVDTSPGMLQLIQVRRASLHSRWLAELQGSSHAGVWPRGSTTHGAECCARARTRTWLSGRRGRRRASPGLGSTWRSWTPSRRCCPWSPAPLTVSGPQYGAWAQRRWACAHLWMCAGDRPCITRSGDQLPGAPLDQRPPGATKRSFPAGLAGARERARLPWPPHLTHASLVTTSTCTLPAPPTPCWRLHRRAREPPRRAGRTSALRGAHSKLAVAVGEQLRPPEDQGSQLQPAAQS